MAPTRIPEFSSVRQFALRIGVSEKTVRRWIDQRALRIHRLGRQIRISIEDAESFIALRRRRGAITLDV